MLTSCIVTFDANGGSVDKTEQTVYYGQPYGTLPVPTLQYYKFVGWFTETSFGSLSPSVCQALFPTAPSSAA